MARAVIYLRESGDEQVESGLGLEAQEHACRVWAETAGYEVAGPFMDDEGVCGETPADKRQGLVAALALLGKGDVLLVAKRDRLARGRDVIAIIAKIVLKKGARIVSAAGEGTAGDTPADRLTSGIVDLFAEFELDMIRTRTRAGLDAKRRRGERTGDVPYGWVVDTDASGPRSKSGRLARLIEQPREQEGLRLLKSLADQGLTNRRIAVALNAAGFPTKKGLGPWRHQGVAKILGARERGATNGG